MDTKANNTAKPIETRIKSTNQAKNRSPQLANVISPGLLCISSPAPPPDEGEDGIEGLLLLLVDVDSIFNYDSKSLSTYNSSEYIDLNILILVLQQIKFTCEKSKCI